MSDVMPSVPAPKTPVRPPVVVATLSVEMLPTLLTVMVNGPPGLPVTVTLPANPVIELKLACTDAAVGCDPSALVTTADVLALAAVTIWGTLTPVRALLNVILKGPPGSPVTC